METDTRLLFKYGYYERFNERFFGDMDRKRDYEANKADIISKMSNNVKRNDLITQLKQVKKQNIKLTSTLTSMQQQLDKLTKTMIGDRDNQNNLCMPPTMLKDKHSFQ